MCACVCVCDCVYMCEYKIIKKQLIFTITDTIIQIYCI